MYHTVFNRSWKYYCWRDKRYVQSVCNIFFVFFYVYYIFISEWPKKLEVTFFYLFRSSHRRYSAKKGALSNFVKLTEKHLCQKLFFNKVADLWQATRGVLWKNVLYQISQTLLKNNLWHRCFPVNFAKFLRIPFLQDTSGRLLLLIQELDSNFRSVKCYTKYK